MRGIDSATDNIFVRSSEHQLSYNYKEEGTGGSKYPTKSTLTAVHPVDGPVGNLSYYPPRRSNGKLLIDRLEVAPQHQRKGYGSQLMDELQRRHPQSSINHGDRTDAGKAWWDSYSQGKGVQNGRTAGNGYTYQSMKSQRRNMEPLRQELNGMGLDETHPMHAIIGYAYGPKTFIPNAEHTVVARDPQGKIAGLLSHNVRRADRTLDLQDMRVLSEHRGHGVGENLVHQMAAHTKELPNGHKYDMNVWGAVPTAVKFYQKMGADFPTSSSRGTWPVEKTQQLANGQRPEPGVLHPSHQGEGNQRSLHQIVDAPENTTKEGKMEEEFEINNREAMFIESLEDKSIDNPPTTDSQMNPQGGQQNISDPQDSDDIKTEGSYLTYKPFLNVFNQ